VLPITAPDRVSTRAWRLERCTFLPACRVHSHVVMVFLRKINRVLTIAILRSAKETLVVSRIEELELGELSQWYRHGRSRVAATGRRVLQNAGENSKA